MSTSGTSSEHDSHGKCVAHANLDPRSDRYALASSPSATDMARKTRKRSNCTPRLQCPIAAGDALARLGPPTPGRSSGAGRLRSRGGTAGSFTLLGALLPAWSSLPRASRACARRAGSESATPWSGQRAPASWPDVPPGTGGAEEPARPGDAGTLGRSAPLRATTDSRRSYGSGEPPPRPGYWANVARTACWRSGSSSACSACTACGTAPSG